MNLVLQCTHRRGISLQIAYKCRAALSTVTSPSLQQQQQQTPLHHPHSHPPLDSPNDASSLVAKKELKGKPKGFKIPIYEPFRPGGFVSGSPDVSRPYLVLGIESSCDDTGVAIVRSDGKVLSNVVLHQYDVHARFGGIVPTLAMEAHKSNIEAAIDRCVLESGLSSINEVDAISATQGPGLAMCLRIGYRAGVQLSNRLNKPFVAVNHLEAHITMSRLMGQVTRITASSSTNSSSSSIPGADPDYQYMNKSNPHFKPKINYPFLALLVSGGHTMLCICHGIGNYEMLGGTLDDSVGESFDKAARLLGLPMGSSSGGAAVEKYALRGNPASYSMPTPMLGTHSCDFSYAGLKNAFRLHLENARKHYNINENYNSKNAPLSGLEEVKEVIKLPEDVSADLCASFQNAAFSHLIDRLKRALEYVKMKGIPITAVTITGGVAANKDLSRRVVELLQAHANNDIDLVIPPPAVCTDNGLMVAWNAVEKLSNGLSDSRDNEDVVVPRWPLAEFKNIDFKLLKTASKRKLQ